MGVTVAITSGEIPNKAAGSKNKENIFTKEEIGCLTAQAKSNSSLLWCTI